MKKHEKSDNRVIGKLPLTKFKKNLKKVLTNLKKFDIIKTR